jgi:class 3 adenylate cyclase
MTEEEARTIYERFRRERPRTPASSGATSEQDGSWRFVEIDSGGRDGRYEGVVVRNSGEAFPFGGALGKTFRNFPELGLPTSDERSLGATAFGRYQAFDGGVAIWEGREDIAFPVLESLSPLRRQICIVAFFALRGFTAWSKDAGPDQVQEAIRAFEDAVHIGFPTFSTSLRRLFLKGTGDGVMIVSQADWHRNATLGQRMTQFGRGHALDFVKACERTISAGRERLKQFADRLAIGCGIASGELDRVFLFGRFDFIGRAANDAAEIQQYAWNEICVTQDFAAILRLDGRDLDTDWELSTKGWRLRFPG